MRMTQLSYTPMILQSSCEASPAQHFYKGSQLKGNSSIFDDKGGNDGLTNYTDYDFLSNKDLKYSEQQ